MLGKKEKCVRKSKENFIDFDEIPNFRSLITVIFKTTFGVHIKSVISAVILSLFFFPFIMYVGISSETILKLRSVFSLFANISLSLFGIVFTAYGLFQALLDKELLIALLNSKSNGSTLYHNYNIFFVKTSLYYLFLIIINSTLELYFENLRSDFHIQIFSGRLNSSLTIVLVFLYFILNMYGIVLIKSVLFNIFQASNIKAMEVKKEVLNK